MQGAKKRVEREDIRGRARDRGRWERNPLTLSHLARVGRGRGGRWLAEWKRAQPSVEEAGEEGRRGPLRSDTPPHPLDTPPPDPGPEERVQPQQTAETHSLRAGGGAAPRRAWYGGRAGSRAPDSRGEWAGGGRAGGAGASGTEGAGKGREGAETESRNSRGDGALVWAVERDRGCG